MKKNRFTDLGRLKCENRFAKGICPEIPFTKTVGNQFVREVPASLKSFVVTLLSRPDLTLGTAVTEPGYLSAMGVTGS